MDEVINEKLIKQIRIMCREIMASDRLDKFRKEKERKEQEKAKKEQEELEEEARLEQLKKDFKPDINALFEELKYDIDYDYLEDNVAVIEAEEQDEEEEEEVFEQMDKKRSRYYETYDECSWLRDNKQFATEIRKKVNEFIINALFEELKTYR